MDILTAVNTIHDAIAANALFLADANKTVLIDLGDKKNQIEKNLDTGSNQPGYSVSVWPPSGAGSDEEVAGQTGAEVRYIVRFEVNPKLFKNIGNETAQHWTLNRLKAIIASVLGVPPTNGGVRFALARDAFELMNFDEGLVAYHIRFVGFSVLGT